MNTDHINNSPDTLQETLRIMLMTLEYGGSVNSKMLDEIERQLKDTEEKIHLNLNS